VRRTYDSDHWGSSRCSVSWINVSQVAMAGLIRMCLPSVSPWTNVCLSLMNVSVIRPRPISVSTRTRSAGFACRLAPIVKWPMLCECGCGHPIEWKWWHKYEPAKFRHGHGGRGKPSLAADKLRGRPRPADVRARISKTKNGHTVDNVTRDKISATLAGRTPAHMIGSSNPMWNGGHSVVRHGIRASQEQRAWAKTIRRRANHTCERCGHRSKRHMHAHHKLPISSHPHMRLDLDNGECLCRPCHALAHPTIRVLHVKAVEPNTV
jgi:hypothetical protein